MSVLSLHELHTTFGASFSQVNGHEVVEHYGEPSGEHAALCTSAAVLDLSFRGRICLTGSDRHRLLNGQVTNNVKDLPAGEGCYAALVTAKGKMLSDLNIYNLGDELLLDFEPGLVARLIQRFEKYIIADDVQVIDVSPLYGLLSVQGPEAKSVTAELFSDVQIPSKPFQVYHATDAVLGEIYCINNARTGQSGFDCFVPTAALPEAANKLFQAALARGGRPVGWQALETSRIEAGIPRFGADMDETNLPPEAGLEERAISYSKGCYIGQEVIARIRTYGQVAKALRGLLLPGGLKQLPRKGEKIYAGEKEAGYITSAVQSPRLRADVALAYVRREFNKPGTELTLRTPEGTKNVKVTELNFNT